jgi:signal transduction protein with GAF and PtsI domain
MQTRIEQAICDARQTQRDVAEAVLRLRLERIASQSTFAEFRNLNAPPFLLRAERRALLTEIVNIAIALVGADMGNIQLFDPTLGALRIEAQRGFTPTFLQYFDQVHQGQAVCGTAMKRARRVIVEDVTQSPIFRGNPALEVILDAGARSVQSTPLVDASGRILGMLSTHWRRPRRLSECELSMLDVLAKRTTVLLRQQLRPTTRDFNGHPSPPQTQPSPPQVAAF